MSQDLLSSFLEDSTSQNPSGDASFVSGNAHNPWADEVSSTWQNSDNTQTQSVLDVDDDDFGDFEDASASMPTTSTWNKSSFSQPRKNSHATSKAKDQRKQTLPPASTQSRAKGKDGSIGQHPFAGRMDFLFDAGDDEYDAGTDELGDLATNPEAAMAYSKRIIAEQEAAAANPWRSESQSHTSPPSRRIVKTNVQSEPIRPAKVAPKDPNVLFDADNVSEEDDDFGGFESGNESDHTTSWKAHETKPATSQPMPAVDLLGLDDGIPAAAIEEATLQTSGSSKKTTRTRSEHNHPDLQMRHFAEAENEAWDDFETATPADTTFPASPQSPKPPPPQPEASLASSRKQTETSFPPTSIPPPAVLISLFPSVIAEADDALFNAIGRLDLKQRQILLGHPASHQFLKGYLSQITVMARIIAGRKLRWKRDQHLTQSMRIGPAAAGGKGGMKLAGLDKTESTREDREVVDALRLWRNQVGKLRTAVTAASAMPSIAKLPPVPEIVEQMPIKTLKPAEGGITAPHACALCGLKREERVGKVDLEVDDSFGEWWVQGINMHLACREFWTEFEKKLKSR